jgi:hypothetical protein
MHKVRCSLLAMTVAVAGWTAAAPVANADRLPAPRHVVVRLAKTGVHAHHPRSEPPFGLRGLRSTAGLSRGAGYVLRYRMRPGRYVVMESQTVRRLFGRFGTHIERIRQVTRPLNVRETGAAHRALGMRTRVHRAAEPQAAPQGWLTPRARKLLQDSGLNSVTGLPY